MWGAEALLPAPSASPEDGGQAGPSPTLAEVQLPDGQSNLEKRAPKRGAGVASHPRAPLPATTGGDTRLSLTSARPSVRGRHAAQSDEEAGLNPVDASSCGWQLGPQVASVTEGGTTGAIPALADPVGVGMDQPRSPGRVVREGARPIANHAGSGFLPAAAGSVPPDYVTQRLVT